MWYKVCDYIVRTQSLSISKLKCGKQFKVQLNYHSKKKQSFKTTRKYSYIIGLLNNTSLTTVKQQINNTS